MRRWLTAALLLAAIPILALADLKEGIYTLASGEGMVLQLEKGRYRLWFQKGDRKMEIQGGGYRTEKGQIHFLPEFSNLPDLEIPYGEILGPCRIRWGGDLFVNDTCPRGGASRKSPVEAKKGQKPKIRSRSVGVPKSRHQSFKEKWRVVEKGNVRVSVPRCANVSFVKNRLTIRYEEGVAELFAGREALSEDPLQDVLRRCAPVKRFKKEETDLYLCSKNAPYAYLQVVERAKGGRKLITYAAARNFETLKKISLMIASVAPATKSGGAKRNPPTPSLRPWRPRDGSFTVSVPEGWHADGGTADMGRNGYIRLIRIEDPESKRGVVGYYRPFYQYLRIGYTAAGDPPMEPEAYIKSRLFSELAFYGIAFDNLTFRHFRLDEALSRQMTRQQMRFNAGLGVNVSQEYKAFLADAEFMKEGVPYRMVIEGALTYTILPLNGGTTVMWGPASLFVEYAPRKEFSGLYPLFRKIAGSWRVEPRWLAAHQKSAAADAASVLSHYRKMSKILRQSEERMNRQLREWEELEHQKEEIFWDTFYALGGEERYDRPDTGEEIDLPTGADKYLYDTYSQSWAGVRMDRPDARELVRVLKEKGFRELKPHRY